VPAYAAAPRRGGLFVALAGIVALAAIVALAIFATGGRVPATESPGSTPGARADDARKDLEARKAALEEASREVMKPGVSAPPASQTDAGPATGAEPASAVRPEATATPEPPPGSGGGAADARRAQGRAGATQPAARAGTAPAPGARAPAPAKPTNPPPKPASPTAPATVPATSAAAPVPNAERWTQMNDEMSRCSSDSVIPRVQCERRIRARYCDGWWGTVPECPASRPAAGN